MEDGKMLNACVLLKVVPTKADAILNTVKAIKGVRKAYFTYGRFDIAVFLEVENYKQLRDLTGQINDLVCRRRPEKKKEA